MSFEVLKLINSFHWMNQFAKIWVFSASYTSYESFQMNLSTKSFWQNRQNRQKLYFDTSYASCEKFQLIKIIYRPIQILNSLIYFWSSYLIYEAFEYFNSFWRQDQFAKTLKFPSYFSSEVFKLTNSLRRLNQSVCETIEFFKPAI